MKATLLVLVVIGVSVGGGTFLIAGSGPQSGAKHIELANFPNPPVEILTVKLGNRVLDNQEEFVATSDWTSKLDVTVKNVSDRPIRYIEILLYAPGDTDEAEATFNSSLEFQSGNGVDPVQPGQNAKLKHTFTHGNILNSQPARIQVNRVEWENDSVNIWIGGKMYIKGPNGEYSRAPKSTLKYSHPPRPSLPVRHPKPVAMPTPILTYCNTRALPVAGDCHHSCAGANCVADSFYDLGTPNGWCVSNCDSKLQNTTLTCRNNVCGAATCNTTYSGKSTVICEPIGNDPILIDLAGDGFSLTDQASGVAFDYGALGGKPVVSWTALGSDDAFLAYDRNGNGEIDNGAELFGDATPQPVSWAPNGFRALNVFDSNHNGMIDDSDAEFQNLLLWCDANHNGISESDELSKLNNSPVRSIALGFKLARESDPYGNSFRYKARVQGVKGQRFAYDVFLLTR